MTKFRISYAIANRPLRKELVVESASGQICNRSVARAILKHEFAEVDAPFGIGECLTAEQALARFAIADVRVSAFSDDCDNDH